MSHQAVAWAMEVRVGDPTLKSLLVAIAHRADRQTWACWPSLDALAFDTEVSKRTIQRRLDDLVERGFIRIEKRRRSDGTQDSSMITITGGQIVTLSPPVDKNGLTGGQKQRVPVDTAVHLNKQEEQEEQSYSANAASEELFPQNIPPQQASTSVNNPTTELYREGRKILGSTSGGLIKKLLDAKKGNIAQARAALILAADTDNPREYIGGVLKNRENRSMRDYYDPAGGYGDTHW